MLRLPTINLSKRIVIPSLVAAGILLAVLMRPQPRDSDEQRLAEAKQLLHAMRFCEMLEQSLIDMKKNRLAQWQQSGITPTRDMLDQLDQMMQLIAQEMDCQALLEANARIYTDYFSLDQLRDINAFYQSSSGRRFNELLPEITRRSSALGVERINHIMPDILRNFESNPSPHQTSTQP